MEKEPKDCCLSGARPSNECDCCPWLDGNIHVFEGWQLGVVGKVDIFKDDTAVAGVEDCGILLLGDTGLGMKQVQ